MKIKFESENNYIQFDRTPNGNVYVILAAQDPKNLLSSIVNTVELSQEDLIKLVESVGIEIKTKVKT